MSTPQDLIDAARRAARNAYAPYSNYAVGAAVLLSDGSITTGTNFENASYGLSLCAETVALAAVNAQGRFRDVVAIGVAGGLIGEDGPTGTDPVTPCGRCRQILNEAAQLGDRDIAVHCAGMQGETIASHMMSELLPVAFGPRNLGLI